MRDAQYPSSLMTRLPTSFHKPSLRWFTIGFSHEHHLRALQVAAAKPASLLFPQRSLHPESVVAFGMLDVHVAIRLDLGLRDGVRDATTRRL